LIARRALLLGGAGVVSAGVLSARELRGNPSSPHPVPAGPVGAVVSGSFRSVAVRATTGWSVAYPHGSAPGTPLPLLLVLHGRGGTHREAFGTHHLDRFLSAAVRAGVPAFAVASVDGGDHSYWHPRASGEDPQRMVVDELLPLLRARGLRTDRLALGGWSMGGYGALLLAERLGRSRVAAVAVDSPALWSRWQDSAPGAFDGPQDFAAHDVLASTAALAGISLRVSCGTSDPFLPGVRALLAKVPTAGHDLARGGHDVAWWQHAAPAQLAFAGRALAG
jgi:enterochelin esterase-like enzyme